MNGSRGVMRRFLLVLAVGVISTTVQLPAWAWLLRHNLARGEQVVAQHPDRQNSLVLSADFLEYRDYYRDFPTAFADLHGSRIDIEFYKRPLYGAISGTLNILVHEAFDLEYPGSMYAILSFYAAISVTLLGWLATRLGLAWPEAMIVSLLGATSFSWMSLFSVPESYSLSVVATLLILHSGLSIVDARAERVNGRLLRHLLFTVLASWIYIPLCGAILMMVDSVKGRRQWLTVVLPCTVLAVLGMALPHLIRGNEEIAKQVGYASRWSSLGYFLDVGVYIRVASALLFFGIVAPVADFVHAAPRVDLSLFVLRWQSVLGATLLTGCYGWLVRSLRLVSAPPILGALLWFLSLFLFHVLFNPGEVLLHVVVPTAVLLYLIAVGLARTVRSQMDRRAVLASLLVLVGSLTFINVRSVLGV